MTAAAEPWASGLGTLREDGFPERDGLAGVRLARWSRLIRLGCLAWVSHLARQGRRAGVSRLIRLGCRAGVSRLARLGCRAGVSRLARLDRAGPGIVRGRRAGLRGGLVV